MTPAAATSAPTLGPCQWEESWGDFANWAAEKLGLALEFNGDGFSLSKRDPDSPAEAPPLRTGLGSALFSRRRQRDAQTPEPECYATPDELAAALLSRFELLDRLPDLAPREQPERVHELAPRLTGAYRVDRGGMHIAGCSFTDVPFLRLTRVDHSTGDVGFAHQLIDQHAQPIDREQAEALGLCRTKEHEHPPNAKVDTPPRPLAEDTAYSAVVWAKWVTGNLQFTIGDHTLSAPFEGWSQTLTAPPVTCPLTGAKTFHLTALSDGRIAAAEQAGRCEVSDRVVLKRDLVTCSVTGKQVAADLCETCAVTDLPALKECFAECSRCGERVSRAALRGARCDACRQLRAVGAGDPALAAILAAYPPLAALSRWRLAETNDCYLLQGGRLLKRYLLVFDRTSLRLKRAARLGPLGRALELSAEQREKLVGG